MARTLGQRLVTGAPPARRRQLQSRAYTVVSDAQAVEPFLTNGRLSESERAMLMGGACAKAYRWTPKKEQGAEL